jgi:hypothetical protein
VLGESYHRGWTTSCSSLKERRAGGRAKNTSGYGIVDRCGVMGFNQVTAAGDDWRLPATVARGDGDTVHAPWKRQRQQRAQPLLLQ